MATKLTEEIKEYLKENSLGQSPEELGKKFNVTRHTITKWERELGLPTYKEVHNYHKYDNYIIENYYKRTAASLAKEIGCSGSYVTKVWKEANLSEKGSFRYYCNNQYFSKIDTSQKAYWLGFIAADGCLYKREKHQGLITISIHEKDEELLIQLKKDLNATHPISHKNQYISFSITSQKMFEDLNNYGIYPQKTWKMDFNKIFNLLGKELFCDFLRGYFDGDGSICLKERPSDSKLSFSIPQASGEQLKEILKKEYNIKMIFVLDKTYKKYAHPFGSLNATNASAKYLLGKILYPSDKKFGLLRKKERILKLLSKIEINETNRSENLTAVSKWEELLETLKWQSAAEPNETNKSNWEGSTTNE